MSGYGLWIPRKARQRILVLGATIRSRLGVGDESRGAKQAKKKPNGSDRRVFYTRTHMREQTSGRGDMLEGYFSSSLPSASEKKILDDRCCSLIEKIIRYMHVYYNHCSSLIDSIKGRVQSMKWACLWTSSMRGRTAALLIAIICCSSNKIGLPDLRSALSCSSSRRSKERP